MNNKQFYPSYIPSRWIHYTRHKKKRIRKKYQNRIRREVRRHKVDAETYAFLLADAAARRSRRVAHNRPAFRWPPSNWEWQSSPLNFSPPELKSAEIPEISKRLAALGESWGGDYASRLFALSLPQIRIPDITAPGLRIPEIEIPEVTEGTLDAMGDLREAFEKLKESLLEAFKPIVDWLIKVAKRLFKWARDFVDHLWCDNRRWWYMAEHHKKHRIRKKYRNKIKREARRRTGELLAILTADDSEDDETASDDEEGP